MSAGKGLLGDPADPLPIAAVKGKNLGPQLPCAAFLFLSGVRTAAAYLVKNAKNDVREIDKKYIYVRSKSKTRTSAKPVRG